MFFENNRIENINENVDYDKLKKFEIDRGMPYYEEDVASQWNAYAQQYGSKHGLTYSEQLSFGYMCSSLFGGMGYSCSTEMYYKEEEIFDDAIDSLNRLRESGIPEDEVIKKLFEHIFKIYSEKIEEYSFKTEKLNLKISLSMLEHLDDVPGDSKSEKFRTLMREYLHK